MIALASAAGDIQFPSVEFWALSPLLIVFGVACVGVLLEAFLKPADRIRVQPAVAVVGFAAAFVTTIQLRGEHRVVAAGNVAVDGPALFMGATILALGITSVILLSERKIDSTGGALVASAAVLPGSVDAGAIALSKSIQTEAYPLMVFAVGGMMLFAQSNTLLTMFVALEILSLPLYLMAGLARRQRLLSQEAAMKYFLLGAFSSAFFLYGLALLYGYAGTVTLSGIATAIASGGGKELYLYLGMAMLVVGLLFKVGAAPFHSWTPDVYQGSPTPVTAFMAAGTKVAAFGAILRVFYVAFGDLRWDWRPVMWGAAILTMIVGSVIAITQTDVKRMLAYSSIAHAGFILVGVAAANRDGLSSSMFYLAVYGFTTIGAFAIVTLVRDANGEATHLAQWQGLGKKSPLLAGAFAFFLLALAGIPLTSGFVGKFAVFQAAIAGNATILVVVGVLASAIAAFFYARVIVLMFFQEPVAGGATVAIPSGATAAAIAIGLAVTLVMGIVPGPLLDLADKAALFVR